MGGCWRMLLFSSVPGSTFLWPPLKLLRKWREKSLMLIFFFSWTKHLHLAAKDTEKGFGETNLPGAFNLPIFAFKSDFYFAKPAPHLWNPLLRGFDGNAGVAGPPGYEILLRQTWCYVILHNRGGSSAGSWSGALEERLYGSAYGMNSLTGSTHSWIPGP